MNRHRASALNVYLNGQIVGYYRKGRRGEKTFDYAKSWLENPRAIALSLSLPLSDKSYAGDRVSFYFENLLPDSEEILRIIAERTGAAGRDAYSLLYEIGRDCVGALQFLPESEPVSRPEKPSGKVLSENEIVSILSNLGRAPFGIEREGGFRISLAGAQEKAAFLKQGKDWLEPSGLTPTTHIFKPKIGVIRWESGDVDFSESVANEYYCLSLLKEFLPKVASAEIIPFGGKDVLVVERFDRFKTQGGAIIRLPQEDMCQALGYPPTRKYQNQGGPKLADILNLLESGDIPTKDQMTVLKSQILFWLIGATDGHAKNFSIYLTPENSFRLTPIYDVLSAQPAFDAKQILHKDFRLAMSVGKNNHYKIKNIHGRHFVETAIESGLSKDFAQEAIMMVKERFDAAFENVLADLPRDFPSYIHHSIKEAASKRLPLLDSAFG